MSLNAIEVAKLSKRYDATLAVDAISFSIRRGITCALLGGNGAGKTTTLAMLLGLLLPSSGSITILEEDMLRHRYRVLPRMNFTSPYVDLPKRLTVAENLAVYARLYGVVGIKARIAKLASELEFEEFLDRAYGTLSAGQKTRVSVAKSLLNEPELLLLDEPTASLDPDAGDRVRGFLIDYQKRTGATLLLASHNMPEVERMCDDVIMLRAGRIVDSGTPAALIARYGRADLEQVFLAIARQARDEAPAAIDVQD
ncbi:MAG: ATP-binding cassette domain-containing protein [Burkholderiales bacterium]|nr:ATP-binding cassette domain-containing protein [Burkholderiales bacterium]MDQ3196975.1 ATP-binding cassette domain-containing protein [Pseudomonadota bacterium]